MNAFAKLEAADSREAMPSPAEFDRFIPRGDRKKTTGPFGLSLVFCSKLAVSFPRDTVQVTVGSKKDLAAADGRCRTEIFRFCRQPVRGQLLQLVSGLQHMNVTTPSDVVNLAVPQYW
jgi:hypothetical protein